MTTLSGNEIGRVVIIGAGQAGARTAAALRKGGYDKPIALIGDEATLPYERPILSKELLMGRSDIRAARIFEEAFYREQNIELRLGENVAEVDTGRRELLLGAGNRLRYEHLIFATGARARRLDIANLSSEKIRTLRNIDDAIALKAYLQPNRSLAVVGGGFIGLEVAAVAAKLGCQVTVIEARGRLLERSVSFLTAEALASEHAKHGVSFKLGCTILHGEEFNNNIVLSLSDGSRIESDIVLAGIGALPNLELAKSSGIACSSGIEVDAFCQTDTPHVFAVGDVACQFNSFYGASTTLESWENAERQAEACALAILDITKYTGAARSRPSAAALPPWFWTSQYDFNLQILGRVSRADRMVVRGNSLDPSYIAFHFKDDSLCGAELVNVGGREKRAVKDLINQRRVANEGALADPECPLSTLRAI